MIPHLLRYQSLAVADYSCGFDAFRSETKIPLSGGPAVSSAFATLGSSPIAYHSKLHIFYTIIFTLTFTFCCVNQKYSISSQVQSSRFQVEDSYFLKKLRKLERKKVRKSEKSRPSDPWSPPAPPKAGKLLTSHLLFIYYNP